MASTRKAVSASPAKPRWRNATRTWLTRKMPPTLQRWPPAVVKNNIIATTIIDARKAVKAAAIAIDEAAVVVVVTDAVVTVAPALAGLTAINAVQEEMFTAGGLPPAIFISNVTSQRLCATKVPDRVLRAVRGLHSEGLRAAD